MEIGAARSLELNTCTVRNPDKVRKFRNPEASTFWANIKLQQPVIKKGTPKQRGSKAKGGSAKLRQVQLEPDTFKTGKLRDLNYYFKEGAKSQGKITRGESSRAELEDLVDQSDK